LVARFNPRDRTKKDENISTFTFYYPASNVAGSLLAEVSICAGKRRRRDLYLDLTLPQSMIVDESNQFVKQVLKPV
jgi:hypothetical protein